MKGNSVIAGLLSVFSVLFLSDFRILETIYFVPNLLWVLPFFIFYFFSVWYFYKAFKSDYKLRYRFIYIFFGGLGVVSLLCIGFSIWKINHGNIWLNTNDDFQLSLKNIFFWVVYQSYLVLFFFSAFKQLVTIK